ncbi:MAG: hypothetical protein JSS27_11550 [Planctomycetes bacterium]|nr:hypothetical protein [Planctomycetota bacterium]
MRWLLAAALLFAGLCSSAQAAPPGAWDNYTPDPHSVVRHGPAYRYPQAGWTVLHIEGGPYERGYQHGRLMAREIVALIGDLATERSPKAPEDAWQLLRQSAAAMYLRRFHPEYIEEMKGIADGAAAAGAEYADRPIDLTDIVAVNVDIEASFMEAALGASPTGLEGRKFAEPIAPVHQHKSPDRCSAFVVTAPATADGEVMIGHITMFVLLYVRHYNVWLDIQPTTGRRVAMQSFPGGIMSGLDYYLNDAGILICETTVDQTSFEPQGSPFCSRIRQAAQYSTSLDEVISTLSKENNGLYTNEWLLADVNTKEIVMFELGTRSHKLWRSTKGEWPGGATGFYWGCNNAKDLHVRLDTLPNVKGKPGNVVVHTSDRDLAWLKLFDKYTGKIDLDFGFRAFSTPPLVGFPSCDAKFTTAKLARDMKTWGVFGPPLGRTWDESTAERKRFGDVRPLVANDWTLLGPSTPSSGNGTAKIVDLKSPADDDDKEDKHSVVSPDEIVKYPAAWHGTLLPASDADAWLAAGFSDLEKIVSLEQYLRKQARGKPLDAAAREQIELARFEPWSRWLAAEKQRGAALSLNAARADWRDATWYPIVSGRGTMLLAALRTELGADIFDAAADKFGREWAGKEVSSHAFQSHMEKAAGRSLGEFFKRWLEQTTDPDEDAKGNFWSIGSFRQQLDQTVIVYGTLHDVAAQREAADRLQRQIARTWSNAYLPIRADTDVQLDDLRGKHVLLIGRPATNAWAARWADKLPVSFGTTSFTIREQTFAHPDSAVIAAGPNPENRARSLVVFAGLSADATWHVVSKLPKNDVLWPQAIVRPAIGRVQQLGAARFTPAAK